MGGGEKAGRKASDAEWEALCQRSGPAGLVYAVVTTGIHCRPGCPARLPLRQNLRLFDSREAAEAAGYRACLRCGGEAGRDQKSI